MKNKIKISIALAILIVCIFFLGYKTGESKIYSKQYNYYDKTEALLDSIYNWDKSFMDTVMESDAYHEYELSCIELNGYH